MAREGFYLLLLLWGECSEHLVNIYLSLICDCCSHVIVIAESKNSLQFRNVQGGEYQFHRGLEDTDSVVSGTMKIKPSGRKPVNSGSNSSMVRKYTQAHLFLPDPLHSITTISFVVVDIHFPSVCIHSGNSVTALERGEKKKA